MAAMGECDTPLSRRQHRAPRAQLRAPRRPALGIGPRPTLRALRRSLLSGPSRQRRERCLDLPDALVARYVVRVGGAALLSAGAVRWRCVVRAGGADQGTDDVRTAHGRGTLVVDTDAVGPEPAGEGPGGLGAGRCRLSPAPASGVRLRHATPPGGIGSVHALPEHDVHRRALPRHGGDRIRHLRLSPAGAPGSAASIRGGSRA